MKFLLLLPALLAVSSAAENILYRPVFHPYFFGSLFPRAFPGYGVYPFGLPVSVEAGESNKKEAQPEESSRKKRDVFYPQSFSFPYVYSHPYPLLNVESPEVEVKAVGNTILPYGTSGYSNIAKEAHDYPIFETAYPHYPIPSFPHSEPYYRTDEKEEQVKAEEAPKAEKSEEVEEPEAKADEEIKDE